MWVRCDYSYACIGGYECRGYMSGYGSVKVNMNVIELIHMGMQVGAGVGMGVWV